VTSATDADLARFAADVGHDDAICVAGGKTQWEVGGLPDEGTRELTAPAGIVFHHPAEMIVRVRAGTTVAELLAVTEPAGQTVPLDRADPDRATVGGVLSVGHSGIRRLRYGHIRDAVLEVRYVNSAGALVKAGGPVVKNVSGFDLCRLLVGSLGTLGQLADVVLRCTPIHASSRWFAGRGVDPFDVHARLFRPSSILWDGATTWVLLEGHPDDVQSQASDVLGERFGEVEGPPSLPVGPRSSARPSDLPALARVPSIDRGEPLWIAEVGVGTVHGTLPEHARALVPEPQMSARALRLCAEVKKRFDPYGRFNPGRSAG
jgi:glycolate oxidase FAD binding subunit